MNKLLAIALLATVATAPAHAAEVYFDTVNTASATRLHGAYVGAFVGGANVTGTSTNSSKALRGVGVDGDSMGWIGGLEFGYKWVTPVGLNFAAELEFLYLSQDISGSADGTSYRSNLGYFGAFGNGVVQLDLEGLLGQDAGWVARLKPYIGAGVGYGYGYENQINIKRSGGRERAVDDGGETSFAYQLFAGLEVEMADNFSIYGEYRYLDIYDFGNGTIEGADVSTWIIGARFNY